MMISSAPAWPRLHLVTKLEDQGRWRPYTLGWISSSWFCSLVFARYHGYFLTSPVKASEKMRNSSRQGLSTFN
jgi:hypothetical protein